MCSEGSGGESVGEAGVEVACTSRLGRLAPSAAWSGGDAVLRGAGPAPPLLRAAGRMCCRESRPTAGRRGEAGRLPAVLEPAQEETLLI